MTLFTDNPLERMMIQKPGDGRRGKSPSPPVPVFFSFGSSGSSGSGSAALPLQAVMLSLQTGRRCVLLL